MPKIRMFHFAFSQHETGPRVTLQLPDGHPHAEFNGDHGGTLIGIYNEDTTVKFGHRALNFDSSYVFFHVDRQPPMSAETFIAHCFSQITFPPNFQHPIPM